MTTVLHHAIARATSHPEQVYLTQPQTGGAAVDYTWRQVIDEASRLAGYLRGLGLAKGDRVAMLSKNCAHHIIGELGIWMAGLVTVAIFPTEHASTVEFVTRHSEAKAILVGKLDDWSAQAPGVARALPRIALPLAPTLATSDDAIVGGAVPWADVLKTAPLTPLASPTDDDLAMIIYTSGSTGEPKGVAHAFGPITRVGEAFTAMYGITAADRALSYLPLAHVYERAILQMTSLLTGMRLYFAEALETFVADLQRARPTLFLSVPRLWLKFQQGVFAKVPPKKLNRLLSIPIVRGAARKKVLRGLGLDSVRIAGSGSAPIPPDLIAWYRKLGLNLMEGYAMTEDFALSHTSRMGQAKPGYVGVPCPGVEVRISDEGEIQIKSPGRMVGYWLRPDLDAEAFTADGFFRTGDRGERSPDGLLKITGRVKELFKTAKGKYVAPAPIENLLNEHPLIELSCVAGSGMEAAYAQVVLAESIRPKLGDPAVRAELEPQLSALLAWVNERVASYEQLQCIVVAPAAWSIEGRTLTPTLKIRRAAIEADAAPKLEAWYAARKPVIWG
jgi:long-chain acyl-CoA synthetase